MINSERNFILWLVREEELNVNSAEFDEALRQYNMPDEDSYYYMDFLKFIEEN